MGSISNALASILSKSASAAAVQESQQQAAQSQSSAGGFGDAVNVTLSPTAQAAVNAQGTPPTAVSVPAGGVASNDNSTSSASGASTPGGVKAPVGIAASATTSDTELLVEEADQQVIPQVGVTGASEVVDNQGNINYVKLDQLLAQQTIPASQSAA
jgi:hypothetical protein